MTLIKFLNARLDDDEVAARQVAAGPWAVSETDEGRPSSARFVVEGQTSPPAADEPGAGPVQVVDTAEDRRLAEYIARQDPARALAEVEAKRRIITLAYEATGLDLDRDLDRATDAREKSGVEFVGERMLRTIALPYADHPDYDESWRP
jgi:hypothetical protein